MCAVETWQNPVTYGNRSVSRSQPVHFARHRGVLQEAVAARRVVASRLFCIRCRAHKYSAQNSGQSAARLRGPDRHGRRCAENDLLLGDQNWRLSHLFGDGLNRRDSIRYAVGCRYHCVH